MKLTTFHSLIGAAALAALVIPSALAEDSNSAKTHQVKMTFSGTEETSATNLLPNTSTSPDEDHFTGKGNLGSFTVLLFRAVDINPSPSSSCSGSNYYYFEELAGGGVFRFDDGSLLYLNLTKGSDCVNVAANDAHCTLILRITGGTGRFKNASGVLTMTSTVVPVLNAPPNNPNNPVVFAATGEFTGTISGVCDEEERPDDLLRPPLAA
ncbi:MAG: hypothetical protein JOZ48_05420 [Acidobacteriaceae bacterium]|nr:hypothetical protein [Acidobacteriaceae bacterium]